MKLFLRNTAHGLIPMYDQDFDEKRKLKIGETYKVEIKLARNYEFHKKYFSLINCAWEYQNEERREKLFKNNIEIFRKTVEIAAGHCDTVYSLKLKEFVDIPRSISFESMDNAEFQELYERVKDVLFAVFLKHITAEEFEKELINY